MKALIFDTETTGMVKWRLPPEHESQPDLIQLGMLLIDTDDWRPHARHSMLVRLSAGVTIEPGAREAHGISEDDCERYGVPAMVACSLFNQLCMQSELIVAHNMSFDESIMRTALHRLGGKPNRMQGKRLICTKEESTDVLKLPGKFDSYKWPTLAEAYQHFSSKKLVGAHDALVDTEACWVIFRGLVDLGVITL
ncbi:MAG: 3'-5' exonuclease [Deltaproteobacteria bacterium]|nr:3'-5' exonuclease [Deltaproteobacteria bacterium]